MSLLTATQMKAEMRAHMGNRTDLDARLDNCLNLSQQRLCRLHDFDELRTLASINTAVTGSAANDKVVSLSTLGRFRKIYSIRLYADTQLSRKLTKRLPKWWDSQIPEPEYYSRGVPTDYIMWGKDQMELWKVPDLVYTMHFRISRWPTVIDGTNQGQTLDLENADDIIIHLGLSYLNLSIGNLEKSAEYFKIYAALSKEAFMEDTEEFDLTQMSHDIHGINRTRGYDDPFVKEVTVFQE